MSKKSIRSISASGKKDHSYTAWRQRHPADAPELPEANPDVLGAEEHNPTAAEEVVRALLDNTKLRLAVFPPLEHAVFFFVHVDGKSERQAAQVFKRDRRTIRRAVQNIRNIITRRAALVESGQDVTKP